MDQTDKVDKVVGVNQSRSWDALRIPHRRGVACVCALYSDLWGHPINKVSEAAQKSARKGRRKNIFLSCNTGADKSVLSN
ncbi:hypothetical protein Y032_0026g1343 [Ancylostoma ceylanicum]|uniref:Uncharacterized protein n=1 Tax=Ancylostoma ceylanicum TaxID=53326 RepID=A0A016UTI4_9BILA|nr:hypothetical protein Y032_0026g1343 [Ancylostoma ceylanicum]